MKKIILINVLSILTTSFAYADNFKDVMELMVDMRITTPKVIHHNASTYQSILRGITLKAEDYRGPKIYRRHIIIKELDSLERRIDNQFGYIGPYFRPLIAEDLTDALNVMREAAINYDFQTVRDLSLKANAQIEKVKTIK